MPVFITSSTRSLEMTINTNSSGSSNLVAVSYEEIHSEDRRNDERRALVSLPRRSYNPLPGTAPFSSPVTTCKGFFISSLNFSSCCLSIFVSVWSRSRMNTSRIGRRSGKPERCTWTGLQEWLLEWGLVSPGLCAKRMMHLTLWYNHISNLTDFEFPWNDTRPDRVFFAKPFEVFWAPWDCDVGPSHDLIDRCSLLGGQINTCNGFYCDYFSPNKPYKPTMWTEAWTGWWVRTLNLPPTNCHRIQSIEYGNVNCIYDPDDSAGLPTSGA